VIESLFSSAYEIDDFQTPSSKSACSEPAIVIARGVVRGRHLGQDAIGQFRYTRVWARSMVSGGPLLRTRQCYQRQNDPNG
jgi:hypothetical protein